MATVAEELSLLPFFSRIARPDLDRAAPRFRRVELTPGEVLWQQGAAVDELAIVLVGELRASVGGNEVGRVRAPDILGEASAFVAGSERSATLAAVLPTTLLALDLPELRTLRWQRSRVYDALLDLAQRALVKRVAATNQKVAQLAEGGFASPTRREPGALARLWRALRPGGPTTPCPPAGPLLRGFPGLREMEEEVEAELVAGLVAEPVSEGQVVVLEGEPGSCLYIVAEGTIEVLRNVRGDRAELLVKLGPGQQFGANTLIESLPRTASCVAAGPGWLYRMDREAFEALRGDARRLWRESVLSTLATQLRHANRALERAARAVGPARAGEREGGGFSELLRASGYLESLPAHEAELEELSFVVDEDARRNPKNRR